MTKFDCIVVGGGMVGAASALSMAQLGLSVAIVEAFPAKAFSDDQAYDLRVSAFSLGSQSMLEQLGAWQQLSQWRSCSYSRLGVWEQQYAYTEFKAEEISQPHLGHIIENRLVQLALWQQLVNHPKVSCFCPDTLKEFEQTDSEVIVELASQTITGRWLIAADGANSKVRQLTGIGITGWDYQQSAMLINVETSLPQQNITWQQYLANGPVAMLPMPGNNASLVWYDTRDEIQRLVNLSNEQLTLAIHQHFPEKLGKVKVIDKAAFPLTRRHANNYFANRVVLLGDAAHTINPMAGQGVNIGFKDVVALRNVVAKAIGEGENWATTRVLTQYERERRTDNLMMMTTMDALYTGFKHPSPMIKFARNAGLSLIDKLPFAKRKALAYACGI